MGSRKYFLDWLRVLAFMLLILFHVGCLYASWDYNIKSPRPSPGVDWVLLALAPWRMALLFLISGVASRYLSVKLGYGRFALDRLRRLLPVILFGSLVIVPPQTYIMLMDKGLVHGGYLHFWLFSYLAADQSLVAPLHRTMPTYDHLWFIVYLLVYTLLFAGVAAAWRAVIRRPRSRSGPPLWVLLTVPGCWLIGANFLIERNFPVTFDLVHDWGSHLKWAGMFLGGVAYAGRRDVWDWTERHRAGLLGAAACFLALQCLSHYLWLARSADSAAGSLLWSITSSIYAWTLIGALCGYARLHLNRSSGTLSHLNEAILPIYVLHQPILLIGAYYIFPLRLPLPIEFFMLTLITSAGGLAIYELAIRPFSLVRVLFGLKVKPVSRIPAPVADLRP